jgi:hypothetical protein
VLIDDPDRTVIEPLAAAKNEMAPLYDVDLMLGSGRLRGYRVAGAQQEEGVISALRKLADPDLFKKKYGVGDDKGVLLFAIGDGNHSLATAKAIWEKIKGQVGSDHPARYALVEIENVHDDGLIFEPIHRVLFGLKEDSAGALQSFFGSRVRITPAPSFEVMVEFVEKQSTGSTDEQAFGMVTTDGARVVYIRQPETNLPVGTLQIFLDDWGKRGGFDSVDYVHGSDVVRELGSKADHLGFYLPAMNKADLFKTVILDGALPRKTFSMGEAIEKRFYMECRRITA